MAFTGYLDEITREHGRGWAWDPEQPDGPVELQVLVVGHPVTPIVANGSRRDLELAGIGNGRHGFSVELGRLALPITETIVHVQRTDTAEQLIGSPARLDAPLELNDPARQAIIALLQSPGDDQALRERVQLLPSRRTACGSASPTSIRAAARAPWRAAANGAGVRRTGPSRRRSHAVRW